MYLLDDPFIALATLPIFPDARSLFFSPWFGLFADSIESEPQRLRSWFGVMGISTENP